MIGKMVSTCVVLLLLSATGGTAVADELTPMARLGNHLFFDENLSTPPGQSCAGCHGPEVCFTGPISEINAHEAVHEGAVNGRFSNRKPPAAAIR